MDVNVWRLNSNAELRNQKMSGLNDCSIISLPKIQDPRGNLSFIETGRSLPFVIQRAYWIYDVPGGEIRGGHAYRELQEFFIALSGSFDVVLDDGKGQKTVSLNRSYFGLYVPSMIWRHLENFATNSVCLIIASLPYSKEDYIRDYESYLEAIQRTD
jgi:dTDP-4-dehydrorhamnose 3,5-epimerase-like enzyme